MTGLNYMPLVEESDLTDHFATSSTSMPRVGEAAGARRHGGVSEANDAARQELTNVASFGSQEQSQGTSSVTSDSAFGASIFEAGGAQMGLAKLNRSEWNMEEINQRSKVLPLLKTNLGQIDGTIKAPFSHFSKSSLSPAQNLEQFGLEFYKELFSIAPELKDTLFKDKSLDLLAMKLGTIMGELIRLLEVPSPATLAGIIAEMALKHVEYGLQADHADPFRSAMINAIKKVVKKKGHKWTKKNQSAWNWGLKEVIAMLVEATVAARPKVSNLKRSWNNLCEKLQEDLIMRELRKQAKKNGDIGPKAGRRSIELRTSADMLRASTAKTKQSASRPSLDVGQKSKRSAGRASLDMGQAARGGLAKQWQAIKAKGFSSALLGKSAKDTDKATAAASSSAERVTEFPMWGKKAAQDDGITENYLAGRDLAGQAFVEIFSRLNPWAVRDFDYGLNPLHAHKMGLALELIVSGATKPLTLQQRLRVLALGHVQMGIKPEMFPQFEKALFEFLNETMGNFHMWNKETEESWRFIWKIVNAAFTKHLHAAGHNLKTLTASWEYIELHHDLVDMAEKFFKTLFHRAPGLQKLFVKPRKMQSVMFMKAMDLIVTSVEDTTVLEVDLKAIAMRHIKYDIGREHLEIFGECLIQTLSDELGVDKWDEDVEMAWRDMYNHVAQVFGHVISTGRNLVSKALASGDPAELQLALGKSPRNKRILAALEIEVDDTVVSPIVWTMSEGQPHLTETLLNDLLTIRGDRDNYYYGRELLWSKHPWIVQMLVEKAPKILPTFLDGHLWTSRFMEEGAQRVNYYVKDLYGDPYVPQNANVYNTTLGVFTSQLPDSELALFSHPCIDLVINLKWEQFALKEFLLGQLLDVISLVFCTLYLNLGADYPKLSFGLGCAQVSVAILRLLQYIVLMIKQYKAGNVFKFQALRVSFSVPYYLVDIFTLLNLVTCTFVLALFVLTYSSDPFLWKDVLRPAAAHARSYSKEEWALLHDSQALEAWANLAALTTALLWLQQIEIFKLTHTMAALLFTLVSVAGDIIRFGFLLTLWIIGFSFMLYWLKVGFYLDNGLALHNALYVDLGTNHYTDDFGFVYWTIMSTLGLTGIQVIMESSWPVRIVYAVCAVTTVAVMLNLLVSRMVSNYEALRRSFKDLAMKTRAELVIRSEVALSLSRRQRYFDKLGFDEPLFFDGGDDGPPGGIQRMVNSKLLTHRAYNVLDQVERYAGSSKADAPWEMEHLISKVVNSAELFGTGSQRKNYTNSKLLKTISLDLDRVSKEVFTLRAALAPDNDGLSEAASSKQSAASETDPGAGSEPAAPQGGSKPGGEEVLVVEEQEDAKPGVEEAVVVEEQVREQPGTAQELAADHPSARIISMQELTQHSTEMSLWLPINGQVHDITSLQSFHPGGKNILLACAGQDATVMFDASHNGPSRTVALAMLKHMPVMGQLAD